MYNLFISISLIMVPVFIITLIMALIKPSWVLRRFNPKYHKRKFALLLPLGSVVIFIISMIGYHITVPADVLAEVQARGKQVTESTAKENDSIKPNDPQAPQDASTSTTPETNISAEEAPITKLPSIGSTMDDFTKVYGPNSTQGSDMMGAFQNDNYIVVTDGSKAINVTIQHDFTRLKDMIPYDAKPESTEVEDDGVVKYEGQNYTSARVSALNEHYKNFMIGKVYDSKTGL